MGWGWGARSSDERKFQRTFGFGRADFANFIDLQEVFASLGYSQV